MRSKIVAFILTLCLLVAASQHAPGSTASPTSQADSRTFPETGHTVKGRFLKYWDEHGGLPQQGYPISEEMQEQSEVDSKTYTVQYFERAVFESHTENQPPNDVLLSLLGVFLYQQKYPGSTGAPSQTPSTAPDAVKFPETGKSVGGKFLAYWKGHGGLPQQGLPISDEFQEKSELDGKTYTVQYFERAVFELHPENIGTPYEVLLSQLGTFRYKLKHEPQPATATPSATATRATETGGQVEKAAEYEFMGGFVHEWKFGDGNTVGWSNPEKGKQDFTVNMFRVLVAQGRYGVDVAQVIDNVRTDPIVDLDVPVYDDTVPGNYVERSPSIIKYETVKWDTRKPIIFTQGTLPYTNQIRYGDSRNYSGMIVIEGQLRIVDINNYTMTERGLGQKSLLLSRIVETIGLSRKAASYPKNVHAKDDLLSVAVISKFGTAYDPSWDYVTNPEDFAKLTPDKQNYEYMLLGTHH